MNIKKLLSIAKQYQKKAYAPYSKLKVGAAILTSSNKIFGGCNVENVSYGLTICAERNAIFNAIANGEKRFIKIAISSYPLKKNLVPCGACCQVLAEFNTNIEIIVLLQRNKTKIFSLSDIFPMPWNVS